MSKSVMVIDDDPTLCSLLAGILSQQDYHTRTADSGERGLSMCEEEMPNVVLLDLNLPGISGMEILRRIKEMDRACRVVMITGYATTPSAVEAMKLGADDYITKPFLYEDLRTLVAELVEQSSSGQLEKGRGLDKILAESPSMHRVFEIIQRVSRTSATVLITGESGTGKELVAQAIHQNSQQKDQPFLSVNSASIPANLLEAELFGYEKGAFTDAKKQKKGLIDIAGRGSLFLDEIGLMSKDLQGKILTVLETRGFRRLGGTEELVSDARFIAATNLDLAEAVKMGEFREDLYYRLNVIPIHLPPLRERGDDILLLARHFLEESSRRYEVPYRGLSAEAEALLKTYPWAGNVRELKNVIERAVLLTDGPMIDGPNLSIDRRGSPSGSDRLEPIEISDVGLIRISFPPWGLPVDDLEAQVIKEALNHTEGNISGAAKLLHLSRYALRYRMKKHGIPFPKGKT